MKRVRAGIAQAPHCIESISLHARLDGPPLQIELVQALGKIARFLWIVRKQAADADGHVVDPPGGVEARCHGKCEIGGCQIAAVPLRYVQQSANTGHASIGSDPTQPL